MCLYKLRERWKEGGQQAGCTGRAPRGLASLPCACGSGLWGLSFSHNQKPGKKKPFLYLLSHDWFISWLHLENEEPWGEHRGLAGGACQGGIRARQPFWLLSRRPEPASQEGLGLGRRLGLYKFKVFMLLMAKRNRGQDEARDQESPRADGRLRLSSQSYKVASGFGTELSQREGFVSQGLSLAPGGPLFCGPWPVSSLPSPNPVAHPRADTHTSHLLPRHPPCQPCRQFTPFSGPTPICRTIIKILELRAKQAQKG